ncbi:unnamed protein product [Heligmosomoides polygyrus]|uniref:Secreted protein n=1 Tax=Heligmosomoides polygyrus TaxID=6339 RepID=A0A183G708_HELPZ|nr:unnamed protein product [Heligmosomoides polygyrus]
MRSLDILLLTLLTVVNAKKNFRTGDLPIGFDHFTVSEEASEKRVLQLHTFATSAFVPNTSANVPRSSVAVPNTSANVPRSSVAVPNTSAYVPRSSVAVPNTSAYVPRSSVAVPNTSANVPRSSVSVPNTSANVPRSSVAVPNTSTQGTPQLDSARQNQTREGTPGWVLSKMFVWKLLSSLRGTPQLDSALFERRIRLGKGLQGGCHPRCSSENCFRRSGGLRSWTQRSSSGEAHTAETAQKKTLRS